MNIFVRIVASPNTAPVWYSFYITLYKLDWYFLW